MFDLTPSEELFLVRLPSYMLLVAVFLLWLSFILSGIIARRFEKVLRIKTGWFFIIIAPTGLFAYGLIFLWTTFKGKVKMEPTLAFLAYALFLIGGFLTYISFRKFLGVVKGGVKK